MPRCCCCCCCKVAATVSTPCICLSQQLGVPWCVAGTPLLLHRCIPSPLAVAGWHAVYVSRAAAVLAFNIALFRLVSWLRAGSCQFQNAQRLPAARRLLSFDSVSVCSCQSAVRGVRGTSWLPDTTTHNICTLACTALYAATAKRVLCICLSFSLGMGLASGVLHCCDVSTPCLAACAAAQNCQELLLLLCELFRLSSAHPLPTQL